jgi:ATP-dependent RNA helicase RhlE
MNFSDLGLPPELLRAVTEKGYDTPTPIQAQAIPAVLADRDVLAGAQTGTGKTAAFVLPILAKLDRRTSERAPRALVLTPTRELAAQIAENARAYGKYLDLRTVVVFGGVGIHPQIDALRSGCDLLIATPGRLLDLAEQRAVDLRNVKCFVLDEADRMLDMGFIQPIKQVLRLLPSTRQNLMFSATYSPEIRELASRFVKNPATIEVAPRNATADKVEQSVYRVSKDHKRHLLAHLINDGNWHQVLVFARTKHGANRLSQQLESAGISSAAIHGNKSQGARVRALADFKANKVVALVATEVAARGLDIKELPQVVNYELPNVPEDYVHRIGRTARAGGTGCAVSLVSPDENGLLKDIERLLRKQIAVSVLPEFKILTPAPRSNEAQRVADEQRPGGGRRSHEPRGRGRSTGGGHRGGGDARRGGGGGRPGGESRPGADPRFAGNSAPGGEGQRAGGEHRGGGQAGGHHGGGRSSGGGARTPGGSGQRPAGGGGGQNRGQGRRSYGGGGGAPAGGQGGGERSQGQRFSRGR